MNAEFRWTIPIKITPVRHFNQAGCSRSRSVESSRQTSTRYFDNRLRTEGFVTCLISLMQMTAMLDCFTEMQITHPPSSVRHRALALTQKTHTYWRAEWGQQGANSVALRRFSVARDSFSLSPTKLALYQCCRLTMPASTAWLWVEVERHLWSGAPLQND